MAFLSYADLVQRVIRRLRMVAGPGTQLYAEDAIGDLIQEVYQMVRQERWWDHLMHWQEVQLNGSTGICTTTFDNTLEGFDDIQFVFFGTSNLPLPQLDSNTNPYRLTGTTPRYIEPLTITDDPSMNLLFRVWPLTSVTTVDKPIRVRLRKNPPSLFTDPAVLVPFDANCLISGAAFRYAASDGTNPAQVESLRQTFEARLDQLRKRHDNAVIMLDPRQGDPVGLTEWTESWR